MSAIPTRRAPETNRPLTAALVDAMIASAFNAAAAKCEAIRRLHPSGMSPSIAADLPDTIRLGWLEHYLIALQDAQVDAPLHSLLEVQAARDLLAERLNLPRA